MCTRVFLLCRPGAKRLHGDGENMNNIAGCTGAMQGEAALEEDEGEKLKAVGAALAGWLTGWLTGWLMDVLASCAPKTIWPENKRSTQLFFLSSSSSSNEQLRTIASGCSPLRAAGDPLSRHAASGRALTSV